MKFSFLLTCIVVLGYNVSFCVNKTDTPSSEEKSDMLLERLDTDSEQSEADNLRCPCNKPRPRGIDAEDANTEDTDIDDAMVLELDEQDETNNITKNQEDELIIDAQKMDEEEEFYINEAGERCPCNKPRPR